MFENVNNTVSNFLYVHEITIPDYLQAATLAGEGSGELIRESINRLHKSSLATSQYIESTRKLVSLLDSSKLV